MIEFEDSALDTLLAEDPGGPVVMLNLLRFRPDGGRESYQRYVDAVGGVARATACRSPTSGRAGAPSPPRRGRPGTWCSWCATRAGSTSSR